MPKHCRPPPPFTRIIDTGTSHHNLALGDGNPQQYIEYKTNPPAVMGTMSLPERITTSAYKMYRHKHLKPTYYQASNTPSYRLVNCVMMIALQFSQNTIAPSTTKTRNLSSRVSETMPRDYTNNVYPRPTIKPNARPMQQCQHKTSKNTSNTFINVPSPQPLAPGCKLSEKAISKLGPESPSRP